MLGSIIGDMVGSKFDVNPIKSKSFNIYDSEMYNTDDSHLTMAVARALLKNYPLSFDKDSLEKIRKDVAEDFVSTYMKTSNVGYGSLFGFWAEESYVLGKIQPSYHSFGNGGAMRISPVAWMCNTLEEVITLTKLITSITHDHEEGIKGAFAISTSIFLALHGASKEEIKENVVSNYYPEITNLDFDELVKNYTFTSASKYSVPQAIYCFLISTNLEDAIRNCVAIGGDTDTIACMAGGIAEAFYNKDKLSKFEEKFLYLLIDPQYEELIKRFYKTIGSKKIR